MDDVRYERPAPGSNVRLAIYFRPGDFEEAKAGYLADWRTQAHAATTFTEWIGSALLRHARRTAAERGELSRPPEPGRGAGISRTFVVRAETVSLVLDALDEDRDADRWYSVSAFCGEAVRIAVAEARVRAGALPTPPARLPNHLPRR